MPAAPTVACTDTVCQLSCGAMAPDQTTVPPNWLSLPLGSRPTWMRIGVEVSEEAGQLPLVAQARAYTVSRTVAPAGAVATCRTPAHHGSQLLTIRWELLPA